MYWTLMVMMVRLAIGMVITVLKWTWNWDRSSGDGVIEMWWDERLME